MKKIYPMIAMSFAILFLFAFTSCSDITNLTDVESVVPIPDGYGQISVSLPMSSNDVSARGSYNYYGGEFDDAAAQARTDAYAITVYNADTTLTRLYYPDQAYADPIYLKPGTYNIMILAGKRNDTNDKLTAVFGVGSNYNIVVTAGAKTSLRTKLNAVFTAYAIMNDEQNILMRSAVIQYLIPLKDTPNGEKFEYRASSGNPQITATLAYEVDSGFKLPVVVALETAVYADNPDPYYGGLISGMGACTIPRNAVGDVILDVEFTNGTKVYYVDHVLNREFTLGELALAPDDPNIGALSNYGSNSILMPLDDDPSVDIVIEW